MKKFFNGLGIFGSVILAILLTVILFVYVVILNIKIVVSENGMATALKRIDKSFIRKQRWKKVLE